MTYYFIQMRRKTIKKSTRKSFDATKGILKAKGYKYVIVQYSHLCRFSHKGAFIASVDEKGACFEIILLKVPHVLDNSRGVLLILLT